MSCGERSCIHAGKCPRKSPEGYTAMVNWTLMNCNVDCPEYVQDPAIEPDSKPGTMRDLMEAADEQTIDLESEILSREYGRKYRLGTSQEATDVTD